MCRTDQAVMLLISDMRFMHTDLPLFSTVFLLLLVVVERSPWDHCNGKCPYQEQGQNLGNM